MSSELNVKVKGMHCKSCAELIKGSLLKLKGIEKAEASFAEEKVSVSFDAEVISGGEIKEQLTSLGYPPHPSPAGAEEQGYSAGFAVQPEKSKTGSALREGIIFGLTPHIGCIGFIAASVLGATIAVELFKPLLMNPWFFHFLVLLSLAFATVSSALYLNKNGILSWNGIKRKKAYLATMYGLTIGINLFLFLAVFPAIANLDTGSFANQTGNIALAGTDNFNAGSNSAKESTLVLQVNIPCSGHASLISGELKKIDGVTGVRFRSPNYFDVAFVPEKTSKNEILLLEVFKTYPAKLISEPNTSSGNTAVTDASAFSAASLQAGSCGGNASGCGCGGV